MVLETRLAVALGMAGLAAYLLTPVAIMAAGRFDFFDKPKGYKGHARPIPYLGGAAVLGAFVLIVGLFTHDASRTIPLIAGVGVLWVVGTIDDRRHVSPGLRVLVEISIAIGLWSNDLGWETGLGASPDLALTVLWVLAVVNAFNLFDNMDGASSSMAVVVSTTVALLGLIKGDQWLTVAGAALAGSCLGFLPYNLARPQARIFLGDGGSMPVGFAIATLVMSGASLAADGWQSVAIGLLLVGVPAADTALVIVSRRRKGISVLTGGRDHLTHRTRRRLGTAHSVAITLGALQAVIGSVALVALDVGPFAIITATVLVVGVIGAVITLLELEEDRLLATGKISVDAEALDKAREKRERRPDPYTLGDLSTVALALGAALSPFAFGFYDASWWVPIGLGVVIVAAMGAIRRPQHLGPAAWAILVGFGGIGLLALLSAGWADSADQAVTSANRWLVIAIIAGLSLILMRSRRRAFIALVALAVGTLLVAGVVVVRMLGSNGGSLFLGGRLHEPLGYINAEATVFIMGIWLLFAAAESHRARIAGLGLVGATLMTGLALLSQSRGAAIAAVASVIVVVAVLPGRRRRAGGLLLIALALAASYGSLSGIYGSLDPATSRVSDGAVREGAIVLLAASVVAGALWTLLLTAVDRLSAPSRTRLVSAADRTTMALAAVSAVALLVSAGKVADKVSNQWDAFTEIPLAGAAPVFTDPAESAGSRLASGAGNRYEYWRVAVEAFKAHPIGGVGAGNYDRAWYADRRVAEDVRQPHSFELQVLSELGLAGGALLALLLGGTIVAIVRVRRALDDPSARLVSVAAVGVPVAWLVHTSADWQHLLPGTTAVALLMLAALARLPDNELPAPIEEPHPVAGRAWLPSARVVAVGIAAAVTVSISGASLVRQVFADHYRSEAFDLIAADPSSAIKQADRSLRLNDEAVRSYYAKAAALARMNRGPESEAVLELAIQHDKTNPVTWALLGDLATRRGNAADAKRFYEKALSLNPLDPGLQNLAGGNGGSVDPSSVG
ncbi:MAG: O-antigen ligase family protein [Solirubrobacteraceae bacterium]|nr:O-antigen ligase family protein [Solirubrobacteraceae bacterium]